jgi:NAD(P)H dehydrogenase (quinone)
MATRPVLVYGATGTQGGPVADQLLAAGRPVRVVTRDAKRARSFADRGAEVAVADLGDPESLREAHHGVDRVVLHLPLQYDFALHEKYGRNAIDAARDAGVSMLVFNTSAQVLDDPAVTVYRVRQQMVDYLLASGVPAVVLQPTFYMDNFLGPWIKPGIIDSGVLAFALPADLPMSWISAQEAAAYAVDALDRPELAGKVFDIGGPEALTGADLAAGFTKRTGPAGHLHRDRTRRLRAGAPAAVRTRGRLRSRPAGAVHHRPRRRHGRHDPPQQTSQGDTPTAAALDIPTRLDIGPTDVDRGPAADGARVSGVRCRSGGSRIVGHDERLLTPAEVAALFGVGPQTVTRWAAPGRSGSIRALRHSRRPSPAAPRSRVDRAGRSGPGRTSRTGCQWPARTTARKVLVLRLRHGVSRWCAVMPIKSQTGVRTPLINPPRYSRLPWEDRSNLYSCSA